VLELTTRQPHKTPPGPPPGTVRQPPVKQSAVKEFLLPEARARALLEGVDPHYVFWLIPLWHPSDRPMAHPALSRPTWSRAPPGRDAGLLYWTPARLRDLWRALCELAAVGLIGYLSARIADEGDDGGEHVRVCCQTDRAMGVRHALESLGEGGVGGATLMLCDAMGVPILLA
jgi:hypothetical protein